MKLASLLRATTAVSALSLSAAGTIFPGTANANLILVGGTPLAQVSTLADSFVDLKAQGFGNNPRLLTLQTSGIETGFATPVNVNNGDAVPNEGGNKTNTPTLTALGWVNGATVGIGWNSNQTGQTGITLNSLTLTIYNASAGGCVPGGAGPTGCAAHALGSFSLDPSLVGITATAADLALQQGNGAAVFNFGLDSTEQTAFNVIRAMAGSGNFFAGLSASLGCAGTTTPTCQPSNDGADSFIGFAQVPGPVVGAGFPGLVMACGALWGLARRRRQKQV